MVSMKTKSSLIAEIDDLMGALGIEFGGDGDGDAERDFLIERCPDRLEPLARTLPTLSLHLLAGIADGPVSVVGLAARSGQLKGTVSKHVQRLVEAGLVERTPVPGNRKEVELRLTADGVLVERAHDALHAEMAAGMRAFLSRYRVADLEVIETVLRDLLAARARGLGKA